MHKEREMAKSREALVVCSDRSKGGIRIWDIDTGEELLYIPTCAAVPNGLLCLRNQFLVASQIHKHGSVGGGSIAFWNFNKPQQPLWSYTFEAIGPLSCTKDGIYIAGGAFSGKAYIWDVTSGRLLKTWSAHNKSLNCMVFSGDDSLLFSGSDDGSIGVWSMIGLLDSEESGSLPPLLHCFVGHTSPITGLLTTSGNYFPVLLSSSRDGSCKVWDFISGRLMQNHVYPLAITAIALHQIEGLLFCGIVNGTIIGNKLDIGLDEDPSVSTANQTFELKGHNGAITALNSCRSGLISASDDGIVCIWDIISRFIIQSFNPQKGKITNLVVVLKSSVVSPLDHRRVSNQYSISSLDKYPQPLVYSAKGTMALLPSSSRKENQTLSDFQSTDSLRQHMSEVQEECTPMAMEMKVETSIESRMWAIKMAKHVQEINIHLHLRLKDLMKRRLFGPTRTTILKTTDAKKDMTKKLPRKEDKASIL